MPISHFPLKASLKLPKFLKLSLLFIHNTGVFFVVFTPDKIQILSKKYFINDLTD